MARRRAKIFSERELEVMNAVWALGRASVKQIRDQMGGEDAGAYTSIATMLKFLESKGALRHEQIGRTYYYLPNTDKKEEQQKAVLYMLDVFFDGNLPHLMETLIESAKPERTDLDLIDSIVEKHKQLI